MKTRLEILGYAFLLALTAFLILGSTILFLEMSRTFLGTQWPGMALTFFVWLPIFGEFVYRCQ